MKECRSAAAGITGRANERVDKWMKPPWWCTCLFVEGIWLNCTSCSAVACVCVCASVSSMFPHLCFLSPSSLFSFLPLSFSSSLPTCVDVRLPMWVGDSCSLFAYIRSAFPIYEAEAFTLTLNASPRLFSSLFFFKRQFRKKSNRKEELNKLKKRNNICLKNWGNSHNTRMQNHSLFVVFPSTSSRLTECTTDSC